MALTALYAPIVEMRKEGLTTQEIAERLGRCRSTVGLAITEMRRAGLEVPPPMRRSRHRGVLPPHVAHATVYRAVKSGVIRRPERCERCLLAGPVQAHHTDYSRPLYIEWLCPTCHVARHTSERAAA